MTELGTLKLEHKNILVTGGAGFIGSNLVDRLVTLKSNVTVLDDLSTGNLNDIDSLDSIKFIKGSVTDTFLVDELVSKADIVFHLACKNIIVSTENPYEDFQVNIGGALNILTASKNRNIEKIIYASSASVYGEALDLPLIEDGRLKAFSHYATSKIAAENYFNSFYALNKVPVTILRLSNVYGIKQNHYGVVAKFFNCVKRNSHFQIFGDGEQTRDFTFVEDVIEAMIIATISSKTIGEVYNVSSGKETSINELVKLVQQISGKDIKLKFTSPRDIDNIRRRLLNIEKIRKTLHWCPEISLECGLKKTYDWFLLNKS